MLAVISIHTGNEAFAADKDAEIARILRKLATELEANPGASCRSLRDINGNTVGHFEMLKQGQTIRTLG